MVRKWRVDYDNLCQLINQEKEKKTQSWIRSAAIIFSNWKNVSGNGFLAMALIVRRVNIQKFVFEKAIEFYIHRRIYHHAEWITSFNNMNGFLEDQ